MRKLLLFNFFLFWLLLGFSTSVLAQDYSLGKAPQKSKEEVIALQQYYKSLNLGQNLDLVSNAYGSCFDLVGFVNNDFASTVIPPGSTWTDLQSYTTLIQGGDIANGVLYGTDAGVLVTFNLTTGAKTTVATVTGVIGGQTITALAYDEAAGVMYMGSTDITTSWLYTIDLTTAVATPIGSGVGQPALIALAISCNGELYSVDIVQDNLWSINSSTGVGTAIGLLGFDANYAQDADWNAEDDMMYLAAYNSATGGELRTANVTTGNTTLVAGWPNDEVTSFGIDYPCTDPCPTVGDATNPTPANGATNVSLSLATLTWTNDPAATSIEVFFNGISVYSGSAVSSIPIPVTLNYATTYNWKVNGSDGICWEPGETWSFTTMQNPLLVIDTVDVYPQSLNYWTGTTTAAAKTQVSLMNIMAAGEQAWAKFDVSSIPVIATITEVSVNWYINTQNCPYFYINALPIDPVTADAATLYAAIIGGVNYYDFSTCPVVGWNSVDLGGNVNADLAASLPSGWFALSFYEFESSTYYFTAQGWAETYKPYLHVIYEYIVPVELTSFTATSNHGEVELSWITATETNNQGFEVQRSAGGDFETIAFIEGHGTTTETQAYSYSDRNVNVGSYSYRLRQIDFDGTFAYSDVIEAEVPAPAVFALDQNYPNPFNPSTKITFQLAVDSKVSVKVFDILGQEVATLVNTNLVAGSHNVNFDASSLNSGVYFYRIEATGINGNNFVDVKKMILTK